MIREWIRDHYKQVIAYITALLTVIAVPLWLVAAGFVFRTEITNATVPKHETRIESLERSDKKREAEYNVIIKSLERIEEREYQELKEARQLRQGKQ